MSSSQRLEFAAGHSVADSESLTRFAPPGDGRSQLSSCWEVHACGYEMFHGWTPLSFWAVLSGCCSGRLLVAVALGLGLVAFGSVSVAPGPILFGAHCSNRKTST